MLDKVAVRSKILKSLFDFAEAKLLQMIEQVVLKSAIEQGNSEVGRYSTIHNGMIYYSKFPAVHVKEIMINISDTFQEKFSLLIEMENAILWERITVSSYITDMLNNCKSFEDIAIFLDERYLKLIINPDMLIGRPDALAVTHLHDIIASGKKAKFDLLLHDRSLTNLLIKNLRA